MVAASRHALGEAENTLGKLLNDVLDGQARAIAAVGAARADIERAAECAAAAMRGGGRLIYVGAGASGGAAFQDYAEMPGTFGLAPRQLHWTGPDAPRAPYSGDGEDDAWAGRAAVDALRLSARDAVSASGATADTLAGARAAKSAGAKLIALVCRSGSALAEVAVLAPTGDEAVSGSTRLAARTATPSAWWRSTRAAVGSRRTMASMPTDRFRWRSLDTR